MLKSCSLLALSYFPNNKRPIPMVRIAPLPTPHSYPRFISHSHLITDCDLCPPPSLLKKQKNKTKIWDAHKNQKKIMGEEPIMTE